MQDTGARVTDAVEWFKKKGETRGAIQIVRTRKPERFRWRSAVASVTSSAGPLRGVERARIEEPVREIVMDLDDRFLQREVVLDARRFGVDLDRGELLPQHTMLDLRRYVYLVGADLGLIQKHVALPGEYNAPIDTAAVVLIGRAYAEAHRVRARKLWLQLPDTDGPERWMKHHQFLADQAQRDAEMSKRWAALAKTLAGNQVG